MKTLLLVFIHGFKGTDATFQRFPNDLQALIQHSVPEQVNVLTLQYPQYETRGDLKECVAKFTDWLQNKVIDLEVENRTPSPTVDPSVHVILCGHSMGGIVAAEALLSVVGDEPVPHTYQSESGHHRTDCPGEKEDTSRMWFPYIKAVLAFDTPYLGISPGVLAHGAEEQFGHATTAYRAFDETSAFFGWGKPKPASLAPVDASRGLPAPDSNSSGGGLGKWGKLAMYAGAAAGIVGVAGAAYLSRNQITQGLRWAGSHLEFVGCLARGAELQERMEKVIGLTASHGIGFANFYGALDQQVTAKTVYAGQLMGEDRTFCVVPNPRKSPPRPADNPPETKRATPLDEDHSAHRRKGEDVEERIEAENEQVREFADDSTRSKGRWVKCVNSAASDELKAHTTMFSPGKNPDYHAMLPRARDQIVEWIDPAWYRTNDDQREDVDNTSAGGEDDDQREDGDGDQAAGQPSSLS